MGKKVSTEATVKDIRRQHNAEEKIRIVLDGLRGGRELNRTSPFAEYVISPINFLSSSR